jgi:L-ribulose-5-phosphate 4-epimerase
MLEELKEKVCNANLDLVKFGLVIFTWGNVSGIDHLSGLVVIKPSGVSYDKMKPDDMVVVDLSGKVVEGKLNPSSDTFTHLEIYRNFKEIGGIAHTHSKFASAWAQAGLSIPAFGTTHADYFNSEIPCTRKMKKQELEGDYEKETGNLIVETFNKISPDEMPGVLVHSHGPFTWGKSAEDAVYNSVVLENIAEMAYYSILINPDIKPIDDFLLEKHFGRKHGKNAYYGQK